MLRRGYSDIQVLYTIRVNLQISNVFLSNYCIIKEDLASVLSLKSQEINNLIILIIY